MGRRYGIILWALILVWGLNELKSLAAELKQEPKIRQAYVEMPDVVLFLDNDMEENEAQQAEVTLGNKKLLYEGMREPKETGISYYFLLDISASIPKAYFDNIKEGISEFADGLEEWEKISLYTFGYEVTQVLDKEVDAAVVKNSLQEINNADHNTLLFEAIDTAAQDAFRTEGNKRVVIVAITDGEDFAVGKATQAETCQTLMQNGFSMEAVAVSGSSRDYINSLGEFARSTGGNLYIDEKDSSGKIFQSIREDVNAERMVYYKAASNKVSNQVETLVFKNGTVDARKDILVNRSVSDVIAPEVVAIEKVADRVLRISFSENVLNADKVSAWKISMGEENIPIESILQKDGSCIEISVSKELYHGEYLIESVGITDDSKEENSLVLQQTVILEGNDAEIVLENLAEGPDLSVVIGVIVIILLMSLIITMIVIYKKVKRNKGIIKIEDKHVLFSNTSVETHEEAVIIEKKGKSVVLLVDQDGKSISKIETTIDQSLFVGRAPICNVYFNDKMLSNQHFVLEYDGSQMFVTDLNSTNGTRVNGISISAKHRLDIGDVISAGTLRFRIKW